MNGATVLRAIRGPAMLIAWGLLLAADQTDRISITRTWPAILILYGLFKLAERLLDRPPQPPPLEQGS
jgi:hypothetical protein